MYTGTEIFNMAIAVIDELSDTGVVSDSQVKEYKYRAPYLLDMWQHEMAKNGDLYKTYEFSNKKITNQLGESRLSIIEEVINTELIYGPVTGSQAYYFEVDNAATVYIEENINGVWTVNATINVPEPAADNYFMPYKGLTGAAVTNQVRIRFSGLYYYRTCNVCLYQYLFQADKVPDFVPFRKVTMPDDFKSIAQVIDQYPTNQYTPDTVCKWEGGNALYVSYFYEGIVRIVYIPVPAKITSLTQTLEVDETSCISAVYYIAEHFALADQNDGLADRCRSKYGELKRESMIKGPLPAQPIVDNYGISDMR